MVKYWLVRMRPDIKRNPKDDFWRIGQNENLIAIGWSELGDITHFSKDDKDELIELLKETYPYYSDKKASIAASTILRFTRELREKDIVMLPTYPEYEDGIIYMIGRVRTAAQYNEEHEVVTRDVRWKGNIPRNRVSKSLRKSLNGRLTVFNIDKHREKVNRYIG